MLVALNTHVQGPIPTQAIFQERKLVEHYLSSKLFLG
jgi:hypothetical protein